MKINLQLFSEKKSNEEIAKEVIQGKWGNGTERKNNLAAKGYNYSEIQPLVNSMLGGSSTAPKTNTTVAATMPTTPTPPAAATNTSTGLKYDPQEVIDMRNKVNSMQKPVEQESEWMSNLNDTINKLMNGEKFSYDLNGDALYQQYKDQYTTQGKLASMDVMGQAAAMNGGYGSSYGDTVGHQAYQGYLQQLNDRVPELYQLALNQYNQEKQDLKDQAAMYFDLVQRDHDLYREDVSDYYTDLDYYTGRADKLSDDAYTKSSDEKSNALNLATTILGLGKMPSAEVLAASGLSNADAQTIMNAAKEQIAASAASGSGSNKTGDDKGSGGTYSSVLWNDTGTYDDDGNKVFRNSDGKTQSFGTGVNPYIGTVHKDAKDKKGNYDTSKVFSNGYQPNNINDTPLEHAKDKNGFDMYTNKTGKNQAVWKANGKYYLWRGDLGQYIEVDLSDLGL